MSFNISVVSHIKLDGNYSKRDIQDHLKYLKSDESTYRLSASKRNEIMLGETTCWYRTLELLYYIYTINDSMIHGTVIF